jgi:molecular chaperone GrpE
MVHKKGSAEVPGGTPQEEAVPPVPTPKDEGASSAPTPAKGAPSATEALSLEEEAEAFCVSLEKYVRGKLGGMPTSLELGELHAQQAALRDLLARSLASGYEAREDLDEVTTERDKCKDALARSRAEFLNYQTRAQSDLKRAEETALRGYMSDMLPIMDSLDLALVDAHSGKADLARVTAALEMVAQGFEQALRVRGLERIEVKEKTFDPARHEAVATRPADEAKGEKPNEVVEQLRSGYLWKGLLLRPVQVLVTAPPPKK